MLQSHDRRQRDANKLQGNTRSLRAIFQQASKRLRCCVGISEQDMSAQALGACVAAYDGTVALQWSQRGSQAGGTAEGLSAHGETTVSQDDQAANSDGGSCNLVGRLEGGYGHLILAEERRRVPVCLPAPRPLGLRMTHTRVGVAGQQTAL